jgi:hypothetical protein
VEATAVLPDGSRHALASGSNRLFSGMLIERP